MTEKCRIGHRPLINAGHGDLGEGSVLTAVDGLEFWLPARE
jgi:hypothetical protein